MKLGDKVTLRQQVIVLPRGTILLDKQGDAYKVGIVTPQYLLRFAPLTIIYLPGYFPRSESEIAAEALREAADLLYTDEGPRNPLSTATWLRERANRILGANHG